MRFAMLARLPLLAALLSLPSAAVAQFELTVNPERLDGEDFLFFDEDEGPNNQLEFDVDGPSIGANGQVFAAVPGADVTITWRMDFPNSASASKQQAAVSQRDQVLIGVEVDFDEGTDYFGQAAPLNCQASAKIRDNQADDPDDPDNSQASVSCDLGANLQHLDDDDNPMTPGDPPQPVLDAIEAAFDARKDVSVQVNNGKLTIKHKGGGVL
jgi:hypothetical protein